jgi:hypothetical protein
VNGRRLPVGFKWPKPKGLPAVPLEPRLVPVLPKDVEKKLGWKATRAFKDAVSDAWGEAWPAARKLFAVVFLRRFKEEMREWVDWNPGDEAVLFEIWPAIGPLKWVPKMFRPKFRIRDLERFAGGE